MRRAPYSAVSRDESASDAIALKDGGLPLSFLGLSSGVFAATENMKPDRYLMAIDALARRLVASLPYHDKPSPTPTAVALESTLPIIAPRLVISSMDTATRKSG